MGNSIGGVGLPFDVGKEVVSYSRGSQSHWRLHEGTKRANGEPVSIFRLNKKSLAAITVESGQRGFQKLRSLRHPYILACLDGAELDNEVVMATEEVIPLDDWISLRVDARRKDDQVAWGLHCIFSALKFLHESCKQSHNNISLHTIFVTKGGDWKLGGMDLLCAVDGSDMFLQSHQSIQPYEYQCPERRQGSMSLLSSLPIHIQDVWAIGKILQVIYSSGIPDLLTKYLDKMLDKRPERRPTPSQYLRCAFLKRPTMQHLHKLEDWSVISVEEKTEFLKGKEAIEACPRDMVHYKLGILLLRDVEMAVASTTSANQVPAGSTGGPRAIVAMALPPLLDIDKEANDSVLSARLQPILVSLFTMNDRGIRAMLLSKVDLIAPRLDASTINNKLFDPLCAGFMDAASQLRELTLKSMVIFTDKLSDKNMNEKLIRHLARLQGDKEDSIRTNTIIFLGKIAGKLKPAVREKVLLQAFARGISDPFPAARLAGLRATTACAAHVSCADVCMRVLPSVVPCLIDPSSHAVREAAFTCLEVYVTKLRELSNSMKVVEEEQRKKEIDLRVSDMNGGSILPNDLGAVANGKGHLEGGGVSNTWGSWAMNILSEKLASTPLTTMPVQAQISPPIQSGIVESAKIEPKSHAVYLGAEHLSDEDDYKDADENAGDGWDNLDTLLDTEVETRLPPKKHLVTSYFITEDTKLDEFKGKNGKVPAPPKKLGSMKLKGAASTITPNIADGWDDF